MTQPASDEPSAVLPWVGREVTRVEFDWAVGLLLDDGSFLRVEAPLTLVGAAGTAVVVPGEVPTLAPALSLFGRTVRSSVVDPAGTLVIAFDDDSVLRVLQGPEFEAWTATGPGPAGDPGHWLVVSTGSGRLAVWGAAPAGGQFPTD